MDWLVRDYLLTWMHEAGDHARAWGLRNPPQVCDNDSGGGRLVADPVGA